MAKLTDDRIEDVFAPYLDEGERTEHRAYGIKQLHILWIILLVSLAVLPGVIASTLLTKHYLVALTNRRLLVLQIKSMGNTEVKAMTEYRLDEVRGIEVKTSTGALFTHIKIVDPDKPFVAKFHRAFSKSNRPSAVAIGEAISAG
jgi:hypothetical protein